MSPGDLLGGEGRVSRDLFSEAVVARLITTTLQLSNVPKGSRAAHLCLLVRCPIF
ncbi:MAG: hypothetical protein ACI81L_003389 [Verrucomicrobiales bacterium]|jgi:hypothetical protein